MDFGQFVCTGYTVWLIIVNIVWSVVWLVYSLVNVMCTAGQGQRYIR